MKIGKKKRTIILCFAIAALCGIAYVAVQWGVPNKTCKEYSVAFVEECVDILEENLHDCGLKDIKITYDRVGKLSYIRYQDPLNKAKDYKYYYLLEYQCDSIADLYQSSIENDMEDTFSMMMRRLLSIKEDLLNQIRRQSGPFGYEEKTMEINLDDRMERDSFLLKTSKGERYQVLSENGNCWIEVNGIRNEKMNYNAPYVDPISGYTPKRGDKYREEEEKEKEEKPTILPNEEPEQHTHDSFTPSDPYDVEEYDNGDDFADEWADEFADSYNGDYEDGYDDAYDYWEEEYE